MTFEIFEYIYCIKLSLFPGVELSHKIFIIAYNFISNNIYVRHNNITCLWIFSKIFDMVLKDKIHEK